MTLRSEWLDFKRRVENRKPQPCGVCRETTNYDQHECCGKFFHHGMCNNEHARDHHPSSWAAWVKALRGT